MAQVDRTTLMKKLEKIFQEYEDHQTFGSVEICFNRGKAEVVRTLQSEKFFHQGSIPNGKYEQR
jgi:hypothetical protein